MPDDTQTAKEQSAGLSRLDTLRLDVDYTGAHFQVLVYVNDVEMTSVGAGMGMDPSDVLTPTNRLVATTEPRNVAIARCECGLYGCGSTDITITRRGGLVQWDWLHEKPIDRSVRFDAADYDREIARMASDHSWETPERTAERLILANVDRTHLLAYGLTPEWVANKHNDPRILSVLLQDDAYQIFVDTPWLDRNPEQIATAVCAMLSRSPGQWTATWHPMKRSITTAPTMADSSWRRRQL